MDLSQLRSFCAVVETRRFTEAGKLMHRAQSTISVQIAHLEEEYGGELLERRPGEVIPTESGRVLYRYARKILDLVDESVEEILDLRNVVHGSLAVGASTIPATYILPGLLKRYVERYPGVSVSLSVSNSRDVIGRVLDRSLDVGVVGRRMDERSLHYVELVRDTISLVIPPGHPWSGRETVTLEEVLKERFVEREQGSGTRAAVDAALRDRGVSELDTVIQVSGTEAVKQCVGAGIGVSFLSVLAVRDSALETVEVEGLSIERKFSIVVHRESAKKRTVEAFLDPGTDRRLQE